MDFLNSFTGFTVVMVMMDPLRSLSFFSLWAGIVLMLCHKPAGKAVTALAVAGIVGSEVTEPRAIQNPNTALMLIIGWAVLITGASLKPDTSKHES